MTGITKDVIEVVLKNLADRIALALLGASSICLLLILVPGWFGIWLKTYWTWSFFGLLFSLCYLPTRFLLDMVSESFAERKRNHRLENLTKKEKEILAPYIRNDYRTRRIIFTDPVAKGLADDGILCTPDVVRDQHGYMAYNIQNWARLYLKKHPDILSGIPDLPKLGDI